MTAQGTFPDPNANCPPSECGQVSPFIPMQSVEAVHMGLVWKKNSQMPKILYHARFPEYMVNDMADPELVDLAIERGAFSTPGLQFNSSPRDVLHGFDPFLGLGLARSADDSFQRLTYGGYLMRQGLSQSVPTRIRVFFAGENREALVRPDDPSFPLQTSYAGLLPAGDPDQGVPVGQIFSPAYLFQRGGGRSSRPQIVRAPGEISYGGRFNLRIAGRADEVGSIALLRSDHNTHSLTTGDRYVKLAFSRKGPAAGDVEVVAPNVPAQAVPGIYMLFVVDKKGVLSVGARLDLR